MGKTTKALPLLYVEWLDAGVITQGDWLTREECLDHAKPEHFINVSVGWLLCEDATAITLAGQIAPDGDGNGKTDKFDLVMFIPKSLVRKRKVLKV